MKRFFQIAVLSIALISCTKEGIIPRSEMKAILTQMYESDQVVIGNQDIRGMADSLFVYEAIFNSFGYTSEDYFNSLNYYLSDPRDFSKMFSEIWHYFDNQMSKADLEMESESYNLSLMNSQYAKDIKNFWKMPDSDTLTFFGDSLFNQRNDLLIERFADFSLFIDEEFKETIFKYRAPAKRSKMNIDKNDPYQNTLDKLDLNRANQW